MPATRCACTSKPACRRQPRRVNPAPAAFGQSCDSFALSHEGEPQPRRQCAIRHVDHELGHLFLGHLGSDKYLNIPDRPRLEHRQRELEAESVAYIVCGRNGVENNSKTYLAAYVKENTTVETVETLDLYQVMRASGQVETLLGLAARARFDRPSKQGAGLLS